MNALHRISRSAGMFLASAAFLTADPAPQPQVAFAAGSSGTWNSEWAGVGGRTYFYQWSLNLEGWQYAPFMEFGGGLKSHGQASDSEKYFVRLFTVDDPAITSLDEAMNADFDGDGLSNIFEVTFGYDPFVAASTADGNDNALDPENDGMTNTTENLKGLNPMARDNPKLLLQVTAE